MSKNITWLENKIITDPPKSKKKITGTRLGAVLNKNKWSTPFQVWCQCTKTYEPPFEDTKYTLAGKVIESKQIEYLKKLYGMLDIKTPTDIYGQDYFNLTHGDFYPNNEVFGGMWDAKRVSDNKTTAIIECKTTKRSEDWEADIPEYYALQASLYAYLEGCDKVIFICNFLHDNDYDEPNKYIPNAYNTLVKQFKVSERYSNFEQDYINFAYKWYQDHVLVGISPKYDEDKDKEYLKALRVNTLSTTTDINDLLKEAEELKIYLDNMKVATSSQENRYKVVTELIKEYAKKNFRDGDNKVLLKINSHEFIISKSVTNSIDKEKLENDGLLEKYLKQSESYKLNIKGGN